MYGAFLIWFTHHSGNLHFVKEVWFYFFSMKKLVLDFNAIFRCYRYEALFYYPQDKHVSDTKQWNIHALL